jgi:glycosyltransferase involved in cell wall biosynthesis
MPPENPLLTLVIPAYNEAETLPRLMEQLLAFCNERNWKIIIVNDGSGDATKQTLAGFSSHPLLEIVHHKVNKGYGGAIKSGIKQVTTRYCVTLDADGQHDLHDVEKMLQAMIENDADLIVGNRKGKASGWFRELGKSIIRRVAKMMMPLKIYDINSGLKMYDTALAKKYIQICPDSMAFSDVITLTFVYQRNRVLEIPVNINKRIAGTSTIGARTAFDTVMEIINIVTLFNPLRIFLPLSFSCILISLAWEVPILLKGYGISIGALLGLMTGIIFFLLGLLAEQLGNIRRLKINND